MFDIKKIEAEALKEVAEERGKAAKVRIKAKLEQIAKAEQVVQNLKLEYAALLQDVALTV